MPFRGQRVWEGFEDAEETEETEPVDVAEAKKVISEAGPTSEQFEDEKDNDKKSDDKEAQETQEPAAHDLKELGEQYASPNKKFRLPSEKGDGEHHLDSGTTFMNAYKQLKPEQINALTNDTQKLIAVQKDLMSNLSNLKPLISDGKEIMKTFKSFFGSDPTAN
jgi:hypothetical protein